jgi:hypothetical protein
VATRVNPTAGGGGAFALSSGSLNTDLIGTGSRAQRIDSDNYRMNASASYVTGTHNVKIGYDARKVTSISSLRLFGLGSGQSQFFKVGAAGSGWPPRSL